MWGGRVSPCSSLFDAFFYFLEEEGIGSHGRVFFNITLQASDATRPARTERAHLSTDQ